MLVPSWGEDLEGKSPEVELISFPQTSPARVFTPETWGFNQTNLSFWDGLCSGAMLLVFGMVDFYFIKMIEYLFAFLMAGKTLKQEEQGWSMLKQIGLQAYRCVKCLGPKVCEYLTDRLCCFLHTLTFVLDWSINRDKVLAVAFLTWTWGRYKSVRGYQHFQNWQQDPIHQQKKCLFQTHHCFTNIIQDWTSMKQP